MFSSRVSLSLMKRLIGFEVGGDDAQQIVALSGHQVAVEHFGPARRSCLGKALEIASSRWRSSLIEAKALIGRPNASSGRRSRHSP
jgi:hypothetical protein